MRAQAAARTGVAFCPSQMSARRSKQRLHVIEERGCDVNLRSIALPLGERRRIAEPRQFGKLCATVAAHQQLAFCIGIGIAELDRQQETVELRFRQWIRTDLLDGILRGEIGRAHV